MPLSDALQLLDQVKLALEETLDQPIDDRPSRKRKFQLKVACFNCRTAKVQCLGTVGTDCPRCQYKNAGCIYPVHARPGPKKTNPKTARLQNALDKLSNAVSIINTCNNSSPSSNVLRRSLRPRQHSDASPTQHKIDEGSAVHALGNPLGVLSQPSPGGRWDAHEDWESQNCPAEVAAERYFSTGIYQSVSDADPALDPINMKLLTREDFSRLVNFYFKELYPFLWLLTPELHTPDFIRSCSPFLTTCLAMAAAQFCPFSRHLVKGLEGHARYLSIRILVEGLKSVEIAQGYLLFVHWATPTEFCTKDETWSFTGIALRMGAELRIDRPIEPAAMEAYWAMEFFPLEARHLIQQDRAKTLGLMFCVELVLPVLTGRMSSVPGMTMVAVLDPVPSELPPSHPEYNRAANLVFNRAFAKALNFAAGLQAESDLSDLDLRETFTASWRDEVDCWSRTWPDISYFIQVHSLNLRIILHSVSLRFAGPTKPVLDRCKDEAASTVRVVVEWIETDYSILYASNYVVVSIAYSAVLLLKLLGLEEQSSDVGDEESWNDVKMACIKVADALEQIGLARLHNVSVATLYAARIRTLLRRLDRKQVVVPTPRISEVAGFSLDDPSITVDFLGWSMHDPRLGLGADPWDSNFF